jgi:hypothetical protein
MSISISEDGTLYSPFWNFKFIARFVYNSGRIMCSCCIHMVSSQDILGLDVMF